MSNIKSETKLKTEINDLKTQLSKANKTNRELWGLVSSQKRLINRYTREIDDLNLLLSLKIKEMQNEG